MSANQTRENDEINGRVICSSCVGEEYLRAEIENQNNSSVCTYCHHSGKTISIEQMSDLVEAALDDHYECTSEEPTTSESALLNDNEIKYEWERHGEPVLYVIAQAAKIDEIPAEEIRRVLEERNEDFDAAAIGEENPFEEGTRYSAKSIDDVEYQENWQYFEEHLRTQARFFSANAKSTLDSVFEGVADQKTHEGNPVIIPAGPDREVAGFYRARVFLSQTLLEQALSKPDIELAPPPAHSALAGRMNAQGISVFYGATDPDVAISEVRPPVGSRVFLGRFALLRSVRLLDLQALENIYEQGSIFDPGFIRRLQRAKFLRHVSEKMRAPVMPGDEPQEYLITQVICDYLATRSDLSIDGILYPSVQGNKKGLNVVLFHKAARVASLDIPDETVIDVHTRHSWEDDPGEYYRVYEEVPPPPKSKKSTMIYPLLDDPLDPASIDLREPTLSIDIKQTFVHLVREAIFKTSVSAVKRYRSVKQQPADYVIKITES
jgi:hypothetical protein